MQRCYGHGNLRESGPPLAALRVAFNIELGRTFAVEDQRATRSSQRLVRRGCDDVGVLERRWRHSGCDEARDMRHVTHEVRAHLVRNLPEASVVQPASVAADA